MRSGAACLLSIVLATSLGAWPSAVRAQTTTCATAWPCTDPRGCPDFYVGAGALASRSDLLKFQNIFGETDCAYQQGMVSGTGTRDLLIHRTRIGNLGPGAFQIGSPLDHPELFNPISCHEHAHIRDFVAYRLWTPDTYQRWSALRAADPSLCADAVLAAHPDLAAGLIDGGKRGFCMTDFGLMNVRRDGMRCPFGTGDPQTYIDCDLQGLGVCWTETYPPGVIGQWIDITGLADGDYVLENEVNPKWIFAEADLLNNSSAILIRIRGERIHYLDTLDEP